LYRKEYKGLNFQKTGVVLEKSTKLSVVGMIGDSVNFVDDQKVDWSSPASYLNTTSPMSTMYTLSTR